MGAQGRLPNKEHIYAGNGPFSCQLMCISYAVDNYGLWQKLGALPALPLFLILGTVLEYYFLGVLGLSVEGTQHRWVTSQYLLVPLWHLAYWQQANPLSL